MQATQEHVRPIKQFLAQYREAGRLNFPKQELERFSSLFKEQTNIQIDFTQETPFSFMEILTAATWFIAEKYSFRAEVLGLSVGTIKTHEKRVKIKLGLSRSAHAYCWFLDKKIIKIAF
jgi:hypothetical protein